jgi:integrase
MSKLYNEEIKEQYLLQYDNEQTQKTIRNVFQNTALIEEILDKDLYEFSLEELGKAISNTNPASKNVARSNGRFISSYISWSIEAPHRYRKNTINPLKGVLPEWFDSFVDQTRKIHYSYEEFIDLLEGDTLQNAADKALLFLMWEGIIGEQFNQIKELQYSDINWNDCSIYVKERNRHIKVDVKCIEYLEKARNENTYFQYNSSTQEFNEKELLNSNFVFKTIRSPRGLENEPIKTNVIYKRIHTFKELFNTDYLTPNSLKQSGMLYQAFLIHSRDNVLGYDQLAEIGEKYDYSTIMNPSSGKPYFNTFLMREFINVENLKDLYNIDAEIKIR